MVVTAVFSRIASFTALTVSVRQVPAPQPPALKLKLVTAAPVSSNTCTWSGSKSRSTVTSAVGANGRLTW